MVSFEAFRAVDGTPVYLQIINFIKRGAIAGTIRDGDELPSRRVVSALLAVNPNTVQRALAELEGTGEAWKERFLSDLVGSRERVEAIGGVFRVQSRPGSTRVVAQIGADAVRRLAVPALQPLAPLRSDAHPDRR